MFYFFKQKVIYKVWTIFFRAAYNEKDEKMTQSRSREEVSKQWLFLEAFYEMLLFAVAPLLYQYKRDKK